MDSNTPPPQRRENPDPHEERKPIPWPLLILVALLVGFGVVYIACAHVDTPSAWGDGRSRAELEGEVKTAGAAVDGGALYASLCAACHQPTGLGLPGVFPPLAGSEWVAGKDTTAAAIVLHGITGPVTVKGTVYNGAMPAFKAQLGDEQIAAVLSHVRSQWGNSATAITAATVAQVREQTKARSESFTGDKELPPHD
ncbi:cytochrome c [Rhizobacter sp. SG703]|uniref:c-type cytochrome n=1 Tax=Rhizobacter sp. SG703 TaxID=2587140 RepID=UPI0014456BB3|nr:cytochrome c [Rhizobacter sp. SG703]NKI92458.1 mono/diheme cytochrome c family protein [Rhizobacter sp. SG703]